MFRLVTLDPPVIFVAITSLSRRDLSFFIQLPMICSERPSGCARSEGMGYDSAVSSRLTPFSSTALRKGVREPRVEALRVRGV